MRTLSCVSAAFLLLDGRDKTPVLGASILVDGRRHRVMSKGDGHYVLTNLPPVPHVYEISAPHYQPVLRQLGPNEALPDTLPLQYAPDSTRLKGIPHYRLRFVCGGKPLSGQEIAAVLETPAGSLRVVEKANRGERHVTLGAGYAVSMLYQPFMTQDGELMLTGFDRASGQYELRRPLEKGLAAGTLLRPLWRLETGPDGVAILPLIGQLMRQDELQLRFTCERGERVLSAAPPDGACPLTVDFQEGS